MIYTKYISAHTQRKFYQKTFLKISVFRSVVFLEFPEIFSGEIKSLYDMSYGVGSAIQGLIEKTINSLVHESKMGNKNK